MQRSCSLCGNFVSDRARFCSACGAALSQAAICTIQKAGSSICSSAGTIPNTAMGSSQVRRIPLPAGIPITGPAQVPQIPQASFLRIPDGILLQNRFRIDGLLGEGGMGRVYSAFDMNFSKKAAVKEMLITASSLQELQEGKDRFARESRILSSLRHQKIPAIYDFFS